MTANKRITLFVSVFTIAAMLLCSPGIAARRNSPMDGPGGMPERSSDNSQEKSQAANDIETSLREILTAVNEGREASSAQVDVAQSTLQQAQRYIRDFEEGEQADFFMLTAWVKYYQGDLNRAAQAAGRALQIDPENNDVKSTYIAMAVMNDESLEMMAKQQKRTEMLKKRGKYTAGKAKSSSKSLDFQADYVIADVIGKKIPRTRLHCLNSATLEINPAEKHYCVLLWQYKPAMTEEEKQEEKDKGPSDPCDLPRPRERAPQPAPAPMPGMPGMGPDMPGGPGDMPYPGGSRAAREIDDFDIEDMQEQIDQFAKWYIYDFMNPNLSFFALNNDSYENRTEVLKLMMEIAMPWPTVMLNAPENQDLELSNIEMPPFSAGLAIVNKKGMIIYAGPATGQIPNLILQDLVVLGSDLAAENQVADQSPDKTEVADSQGAQEQPAQPQEAFDPDAGMAPEEKFDAEKKVNTATQLIKAGRFTGYKRGIDLCREVMEKWPNSTYAQQARQLLNQIPERYHKRYGITDEELGR